MIATPSVEFRIIGTSIAIAATAEKHTMHVAEGRVAVTDAGKTRLIAQGEVWTNDKHGEQKRAETSVDRAAARADREARRSEREARRNERQTTKAERHK